jgi:radical SAM superfamily enzyme YgiQ (UPF0313 family)
MILINPPVAKACEPPLGIARIAGALEAAGIRYEVYDANLDGLLFLLRQNLIPTDTWTKRALKNLDRDLSSVRSWELYDHPDKYRVAIGNLNRILDCVSAPYGQHVSLTDYSHDSLNPVRSEDLHASFLKPCENVFFPCFSTRLEKLLYETESKVIGISLSFLNQAICAFAIAGCVKTIMPDATLVLGGSLVTSWSERPELSDACRGIFDHVIYGPGESKIVELCKREGKPRAYSPPSFEKLELNEYFAPVPILPYNTSVGCYWNKCTFCPENAEQNKYSPIPHSVVLRDISDLATRYNPGLIHFTDSALSPSFLAELSRNHPGIPWYGFARIDETLADPAFAASLRQSGCIMLELGVESGNDRVLETINKGGTVELARRIIKNLKAAGIATYVYLLFGTPEEDEESARDTLGFVASHAEEIDYLNLSIFNMPVKSENTERVISREFYSGDLSLYTDFFHPKGWGRKQVRLFLDAEFKTHESIARILQKRPSSFTSNHAPLFVLRASQKKALLAR